MQHARMSCLRDAVRMVLGPRPPKANRRGKYADDYERKRACEPVLLATDLENDAAEDIVRIYAARVQIEERLLNPHDLFCADHGWEGAASGWPP